jgi:hypothetical protein
MNAPLIEPPHSRFGGSVATRVLRCPASVKLIEKVPAHLRRSSAYANRGTSLHEAMAMLLDDYNEDPIGLEDLVDATIGDYKITEDDVENALRPAYDYVEQLLDGSGEYWVECRVTFPTIAGAFGTVDLLVRDGTTVHVIDFKFGSGVRVLALYPDGDEDVVNGQLMFYAAAARHSLRYVFDGVENIVLTILQPQSADVDAEMVSSVTVTHAELDEFIAVYRRVCEEALSEFPRLARGDWCRFCAARPICPAHTGPLLDLAKFSADALAAPPSKQAYLQVLADGLNLADAITDLRTALHDQVKRALENGDAALGYTLTAGRAERHWRDDEPTAIAALTSLGLTRDDLVAEVMRSPKQVEIRAKARGLKIPADFIVSRRSGTSLVRAENARAPVRGRGEIAQAFSAALEAFQGGRHS